MSREVSLDNYEVQEEGVTTQEVNEGGVTTKEDKEGDVTDLTEQEPGLAASLLRVDVERDREPGHQHGIN